MILRTIMILFSGVVMATMVAPTFMRASQTSQEQQKKSESSVDQSTKTRARQSERLLVLYKSSATEHDRDRVRNLLNAKVTTRFNDPEMEEVVMEIPSGHEPVAFVKAAVKQAKEDKAVQSVQIKSSYSYTLK